MKDSTMYYNTWNKDSMEYWDSYTAVEPKKYTTSPIWTYSTKILTFPRAVSTSIEVISGQFCK